MHSLIHIGWNVCTIYQCKYLSTFWIYLNVVATMLCTSIKLWYMTLGFRSLWLIKSWHVYSVNITNPVSVLTMVCEYAMLWTDRLQWKIYSAKQDTHAPMLYNFNSRITHCTNLKQETFFKKPTFYSPLPQPIDYAFNPISLLVSLFVWQQDDPISQKVTNGVWMVSYTDRCWANNHRLDFDDDSDLDPDMMTSYPYFSFSTVAGNLFLVKTSGYNHSVPRWRWFVISSC